MHVLADSNVALKLFKHSAALELEAFPSTNRQFIICELERIPQHTHAHTRILGLSRLLGLLSNVCWKDSDGGEISRMLLLDNFHNCQWRKQNFRFLRVLGNPGNICANVETARILFATIKAK
jgi:hypothetical protein